MSEQLSPNLTPAQQRLFSTLADGEWHGRVPLLLAVTGRRFASPTVMTMQVKRLRPKIAPLGWRIAGNRNPASGGWRMVRGNPE